ALVEIGLIVAVTVAFARQNEHVETLVRLDQCVDQAHGVGRMDIVVDFAVHKEEGALEIGGQLGVRGHLDLEARLDLRPGFLFLALVLLVLVLFVGLGIDRFFLKRFGILLLALLLLAIFQGLGVLLLDLLLFALFLFLGLLVGVLAAVLC